MAELDHLSYSSKHQYDTCPEQWRLLRIEELPDIPGVYHAGGGAVHLMAETWNKSLFGIYEEWSDWSFPDYFDQAVEDLEARTGVPRDQWKVAGTKAQPEDLKWWRCNGQGMFNRWKNWLTNSPFTIWVTPDGEPAIELEMNTTFGGIKVNGFIDVVLQHASGQVGVVDFKSGKPPRTNEQLAGYAKALSLRYPEEPISHGGYMMVKGGVLTGWHDLTAEMDMLDHEYQQVAEGIKLDIFPARPSGLCKKWCPVNRFCYSFNPGSPEAASVDPRRTK
jgi:putative RecB family exonuclease